MFILRDLLYLLQTQFSDSSLGRERGHWFIFTLLAVIVPFTSSMTSNLLRTLQALFGLNPWQRRFYTFMASSTIPWQRLWQEIWHLIPEPLVAEYRVHRFTEKHQRPMELCTLGVPILFHEKGYRCTKSND